MTSQTPPTFSAPSRPRLGFIDNLRWVLIVLVVVFHAAVTYGPIGSWFYLTRDIPGDAVVPSEVGSLVLAVIVVLLQAFFMGLFFLISGYFVPASVERKGTRRYLWDRVIRLGVPSLLFIILLTPLIALMVRPASFATSGSFVGFWMGYAINPAAWDTGPMWFAVALLLFSVVAAVTLRTWRWDRLRLSLTRLRLALFIALVAGVSFAVRIVDPIGTSVWNMQLAFFTQYVAFFIFGALAYRNDWLASMTDREGRFWLRVALASLVVLLIPDLVLGGVLQGDLAAFSGGLTWQSAVASLWEQVFAVGMSLGLLTRFREKHARQSRWQQKLADDSFAVYVFFPPVLVGLAILMAPVVLPDLVKFLLLATAGTVMSFGFAELLLRRTPGLRGLLWPVRARTSHGSQANTQAQ